MKSELQTRLEQLAYKRTNAFCYSCYQTVKVSHCPECGSDDLMRELNGVGVEYGISWCVQEILSSELTSIDTDDSFEQYTSEIYHQETTVGWMTLDTVSVMKEMDPIAWDLAKQEYIDSQCDEEIWITFDNDSNYYLISDIEKLLESEGD